MKVAAVQHDIFWEDPAANFHRLEAMITGVAATGARLIVLPELFATGASYTQEIIEGTDGPIVRFLSDTAAAVGAWICGTVALRSDAVTAVNACLLAGPDGTMHRSDKRHLTGRDAEFFQPGTGTPTFTVEDLRVTPIVGHDIRFPHDLWEAAVDTDVFVVPGAEPESRREQWRVLLAARAIENECYVVGVNRVGTGGGVSFAGDSRIIDPQGQVLAAGAETETLLIAEVESALVRFTRDRTPLLGDRAPAVITLT